MHDNIRKFNDYDWLGERIASNLTFKLGEISQISMIDRLQILTKLGEIDPEKASLIHGRAVMTISHANQSRPFRSCCAQRGDRLLARDNSMCDHLSRL